MTTVKLNEFFYYIFSLETQSYLTMLGTRKEPQAVTEDERDTNAFLLLFKDKFYATLISFSRVYTFFNGAPLQ